MDAALSTEHTSTIHNYPEDKFNLLNLEYPTGRYLKGDEFEWFELVIKDANKTITWFKDEKQMSDDRLKYRVPDDCPAGKINHSATELQDMVIDCNICPHKQPCMIEIDEPVIDIEGE